MHLIITYLFIFHYDLKSSRIASERWTKQPHGSSRTVVLEGVI